MFEYAGAFGENKMEGKNKKITGVNSREFFGTWYIKK